ncbi:hypothetical protein F2P81_021762 [Scophthalmus maximus]|uniref:Reverse transcriptase domain-containing protein n=1 Tax=Scophthalmus maximus TaxID=52904 RepID=A0A6A4S129_SCOMX|nr:hypothetical protein F2P81_021762 [Scophthalmus maximus]
MKSFECLVLSNLKAITNPLLDPLQFAYKANRSVDDAVNMALHSTLQHLNSPGTYARILFVDFSSAFNTILPGLLQDKLSQLHVSDSTCRWITDFLSDRKQRVKPGKHVSESQTISTRSPQGCVLFPLLFSLYTNGCTSSHQFVKLLKFPEDTTLIGLISGGDNAGECEFFGKAVDFLSHFCKPRYEKATVPKPQKFPVKPPRGFELSFKSRALRCPILYERVRESSEHCFILTRAGFLHSVRGDEKAQLLQADTIRTAVKLFHLLLYVDRLGEIRPALNFDKVRHTTPTK